MPKIIRSGTTAQVVDDNGFALKQYTNVPANISNDDVLQRFSGEPATTPKQSPLDIIKMPEFQQRMMEMPKEGAKILDVAAGIKKITGEDKTLKEKFGVDDSLRNILAARILNRRMTDIIKTKKESDKIKMFGGMSTATDTGPIAGRLWESTSRFSGTGEERPIGFLSTLIGAKYPQEQASRAELESALKELQEIAFFKGGKTLTGRELAVTIGPLPSMYDDEPTFFKKAERAVSKTIPSTIAEQVKMLLDVGWSEDDVKPLLEMPEDQATDIYERLKPKEVENGQKP